MNAHGSQPTELLRVARIGERNTQQARGDDRNCATTTATAAQHKSLKALAFLALARNSPRNNGATPPKSVVALGAHPGSESVAQVVPSAVSDVEALRLRLHELADAEVISDALVYGLPDSDLAELNGANDEVLRAYLRALRDSALRESGWPPDDETATIRCARCGPVYAAPEVARVLPVVNGLPTAAGCTWCLNRGAGLPIPRPPLATDARRTEETH